MLKLHAQDEANINHLQTIYIQSSCQKTKVSKSHGKCISLCFCFRTFRFTYLDGLGAQGPSQKPVAPSAGGVHKPLPQQRFLPRSSRCSCRTHHPGTGRWLCASRFGIKSFAESDAWRIFRVHVKSSGKDHIENWMVES